MAKAANQKLKLLYILKILNEETDEEHFISTQELIGRLAEYDVTAERKSIYNDIEELDRFGFDIVYHSARKNGGYCLAGREFELPELKLLVDAVQASRFITLKKSRELIRKIEHLTGKYEAKQLQRQVYVAGRIKTENESIYYNVDKLHHAIRTDRQITFRYMDWTLEKTLKPRRNGGRYQASPFALSWQDGNYYLIAFEKDAAQIRHYRVDKMGGIEILEKVKREGKDVFERFDVATYTNRVFGMFGGREETVTLSLPERMAGVIIDRFGREADMRQKEEGRFLARVTVAVSEPFFGWLTGLGREVKLLSPQYVANEYRDYLTGILASYEPKTDGQGQTAAGVK